MALRRRIATSTLRTISVCDDKAGVEHLTYSLLTSAEVPIYTPEPVVAVRTKSYHDLHYHVISFRSNLINNYVWYK